MPETVKIDKRLDVDLVSATNQRALEASRRGQRLPIARPRSYNDLNQFAHASHLFQSFRGVQPVPSGRCRWGCPGPAETASDVPRRTGARKGAYLHALRAGFPRAAGRGPILADQVRSTMVCKNYKPDMELASAGGKRVCSWRPRPFGGEFERGSWNARGTSLRIGCSPGGSRTAQRRCQCDCGGDPSTSRPRSRNGRRRTHPRGGNRRVAGRTARRR